jgi:pteridine reductase
VLAGVAIGLGKVRRGDAQGGSGRRSGPGRRRIQDALLCGIGGVDTPGAATGHRTATQEALVQDKVVFITGGAKRIGAAICRQLHARGARIFLHYRASAGEARLLQAELNHVREDSVALIQADLLDIAKLPSLVEQCVNRFGRLDALVNNASSFFRTQLGEITAADWDDLIGTNVRAPLFLAQAAAPALRKAQGAIVNITDIHADRPLKSYVVYSIAKSALVGMTRSLARELAPEIRVNAVAPGPVIWPEEGDFDELARQRIISHTPLRREGTPEDVARAVNFLLVDSPYITGETINVDGGRHVAI